jgi:hypothetical protein
MRGAVMQSLALQQVTQDISEIQKQVE